MTLINQLNKLHNEAAENEFIENTYDLYDFIYYGLLEDGNGYFSKKYSSKFGCQKLWAKAEQIVNIYLNINK